MAPCRNRYRNTFATRFLTGLPMHTALIPLLASLAFSPAAWSHSVNPYNGTWKVVFDGAQAASMQGKLVVRDDARTWKVVAHLRSDTCAGREAPIAVSLVTAKELVFEVQRSKVLTGCPDGSIRFKAVDDKTLTGKMETGNVVTLLRE